MASGSPSKLEAALDDRLPALLAEVHDLLADGWSDYAAFIDEDIEGLQQAGEMFVHRLLEMAAVGLGTTEGTATTGEQTMRLVFEQIGRRQWQVGNELTRLLTAYQVGARAAWRHVSATALELEVGSDVLAALAEAVFVFVNELSSASAQGYILEQTEDSRIRERSREELADLLLSGRASMPAIREAAQRARWPLPARAAAVLIDAGKDASRRMLNQLDATCLVVQREDLYGAIVADPDVGGRREHVARMLHGTHAVFGYTVALEDLPRSLAIAQIGATLRGSGVLRGDPVYVDQHLDTIIVHRDRPMIEALRAQVLAPLADVAPNSRARLVETLASWLRHMGDRQAVAAELHVHPQTVRYRMSLLRQHFGDSFDSPRVRAQLTLALLWSEG